MCIVCVIGSASLDTNVAKGACAQKIGGVATYGGVTFQKSGIEALVISNVARDDRKWFKRCAAMGLTWAFGDTPATTRFVNCYDRDARRQTIRTRALPIRAEQVRSVIERAAHVHLGPLHPLDIARAGIEALAGFDGFVSLDVQGYLRTAPSGEVVPSVSGRLNRALAAARVIKADASEMEAMLTRFGTDAVGLLRRFGVGEAVITEGRRGGSVVLESGEVFTFPACPAPRVADPTGAGDVFFAAYLARRHHAGAGVAEACDHAARIAARQVSGRFIPDSLLCVPREGRAKICH